METLNSNQVLELLRRLPPQERLRVIAQALPEIEKDLAGHGEPRKSLLGLWADLGRAPSAKEIDDARSEIWKSFPREDY